MTIRARIDSLVGHETDAVAHFSPAFYGGLGTSAERVRAARVLFRIQRDGSLVDFPEWGNASPDLPILWQLTVQPALMVDVWPMSSDAFISRYGVRPDQFARLAEERFVIPNLYHFDSDKAKGFERHEASAEVLTPILEWERTCCRINSIRRAPFLQGIAGERFGDLVDEGRRLWTTPLSAISPAQREQLTRSEDVPGAVQKVASNWAYVKVLRGDDDWTADIKDAGVRDIQRDLRRLTARYSAAAAPYTAAFGGTHLVPPKQLHAVRDEGGDLRIAFATDRYSLDQSTWAGLQALTEMGLSRYTLETDIPEYTVATPATPEDRHFENFLAFLRSTRSRRVEMQRFLVDAQKVSADLDAALQHWTGYFKLYEALKREEERLRREGLWIGATSWGIGTMLGAVSGVLVVSPEYTVYGAALGGLIFGGLSSLASDLLRPQIPELHRKLLGTYEDFRRLLPEAP